MSVYSETHTFKGYRGMSFDTCGYTQNHHHHQHNKHTRHSDKSPRPLRYLSLLFLPPHLPQQPALCFVSLSAGSHCREFYVNGITQDVLFAAFSAVFIMTTPQGLPTKTRQTWEHTHACPHEAHKFSHNPPFCWELQIPL